MKSRELFETYFEVLRHSQLTVYNPVASLEFPVDQFILAIKEVETLLNSKLEGSESRVGIIAGNSPFFLSTLLGIWASHRSAVLISPSLRMSEALKLSEVANLKHFFICNAYHATWTKQSSFPSIDKVSSLNYDVVSLYRSLTHVAPSDGLIGEEAVVLFSSGSTAQPKGIRISSKNLLTNIVATNKILPLVDGDECLPLSPMSHAAGLRFSLSALISSAHLHTVGVPCFPDVANMLVSKGSITHVSANPYIISGLLERGLGGSRYPCPNLRAMTTGGGPIKKNLVRRFYECLPHATLTHLYGLSEATSVVAGGILSPDETAVNVGKFVDSVEMKVTDDQELWLRGDSLMLGYLNENPWPRDEWFPTGDLVEIDEVGNLSITGRKKNIVVRAGRNVNPVEIEAALAEHQGCEDSFVFGVDSEEDRGEDLVAFVVSRDKSLRPEDFISSLRDRLSSYKVPSELYIVDKIERTPMRKVIKESVLREYSMLKRKSGE